MSTINGFSEEMPISMLIELPTRDRYKKLAERANEKLRKNRLNETINRYK